MSHKPRKKRILRRRGSPEMNYQSLRNLFAKEKNMTRRVRAFLNLEGTFS